MSAPHADSVRRPRRVRLRRIAPWGLCLLAVTSVACEPDRIKAIDEEYAVVGGNPRIDPSLPSVDRVSSEADPSDFGSNAPVQVDVFNQTQVAKVDVLWVIDNSGSMGAKQQKVKDNFDAFVAKLTAEDTDVDYHIGVITTDTYNSSQQAGRLQNMAGLPEPWVSSSNCGNVAGCDPVARFRLNASVGIQGSGDEKGLLAAMLALSPPLAAPGGHNHGFLRDDAALFIIILSDEEDSSCDPVRLDQGGCTPPVSFGLPAYYARFFEGMKGYGREDLVTVGVIVADREDDVPGRSFKGCRSVDNPNDPYPAQYAPRYIEVAELTGGLATDICEEDYLPALQNLGFMATGAKSTFLLSRAPFQDSIKVLVRVPGETEPRLQERGKDYTYEPCAGVAGVLNAIRFLPDALPPAGSTVEVEYPVDVRGVNCQ